MLEALKIDLKSLGTSGPPVCMGDGLYEICVKTEMSILTNIFGFSMVICQLDLLIGKDPLCTTRSRPFHFQIEGRPLPNFIDDS